MITMSFNYAAPESLDGAVALLKKEAGARVLAGGQSLLSEMKQHHISPTMLVDLRNITTLRTIVHHDKGLRIGAMTTFTEIAQDKTIRENYLVLNEAVTSISDTPVRNRRTLGGNLAQNTIGADLPAAVMVLNATFNVFGPRGSRTLSADEFCTRRSTLAPDEIITFLDFPAPPPGTVSVYEKFTNRANNTAICGVAANVLLEPGGIVRKCSIAVTGIAEHPVRLFAIETKLSGTQLSSGAIASADWTGSAQTLISDLAASAEYRVHLTKVLTERAITRIRAIFGAY